MIRRIRLPLSLRPVPTPYDPGYPRELAPEDLAALLADRRSSSPWQIAAMLALLAGAAKSQDSRRATRPDSDPLGREKAVLDLLNASLSPKGSNWLHRTMKQNGLDRVSRGQGVLPMVPISYGNSFSGFLDVAATREQAKRLFETFGLPIEVDVSIAEASARGRLDGWCAAKKIGFEVEVGGASAFESPIEGEPKDVALEAAEIDCLERDGRRILYGRQQDHVVYDGDRALPSLYWIAAVVDFLNGVTDGPDVDVAGAIWGEYQMIPFSPSDEAGTLIPVTPPVADHGSFKIRLERRTEVVFVVGPENQSKVLFTPRDSTWIDSASNIGHAKSTAGRPSMINPVAIMTRQGSEGPYRIIDNWRHLLVGAPWRIEQSKPDGTGTQTVRAAAPQWIIASWFDAARPFKFIVTLPAGDHAIPTHLAIAF